MSEHPVFSRKLTWQERAERAEARVAELEARVACLEQNNKDVFAAAEARVAELEAMLPLQCTGCGSTETIEQIRAKNPSALSCCPERNMQPARVAELERRQCDCGAKE